MNEYEKQNIITIVFACYCLDAMTGDVNPEEK